MNTKSLWPPNIQTWLVSILGGAAIAFSYLFVTGFLYFRAGRNIEITPYMPFIQLAVTTLVFAVLAGLLTLRLPLLGITAAAVLVVVWAVVYFVLADSILSTFWTILHFGAIQGEVWAASTLLVILALFGGSSKKQGSSEGGSPGVLNQG